jgi:hypothetical protein
VDEYDNMEIYRGFRGNMQGLQGKYTGASGEKLPLFLIVYLTNLLV